MTKETLPLKDNDHKFLAFCKDRERSVNEISKYLNISPSSVIFRINKLKNYITIKKSGPGRKTWIRTKGGDQTKKYMVEVLDVLNKNKGEMKHKDFVNIHPLDVLFEPTGHDKINAVNQVLYSDLVEQRVKITPEGLKFLKDKKK